jgi:predicted dithiol-disulfide oxidoreductase (DUF899 family)
LLCGSSEGQNGQKTEEEAMSTSVVNVGQKVVSNVEWLEARKELLAKEKEFTRMRDALNRQRLELPWEREELCVRWTEG